MVNHKRWIVELTSAERQYLLELVSKNKASRAQIVNSQILLKADIGKDSHGWPDHAIADAFNVSIRKVERTRRRLVEEGLDVALNRKPASNYKPRKLQGDEEAYLVATCCSDAPEGRTRWTLKMLADKLVEMDYVESISPETVRQTLKKTNLSLGRKKNGVFRQKKMQNLSAKWKKY